MEIIQTIIVIFFFICCAALIFLVLIQAGKGGSMGIMGGGGSGSAFGSSTVDIVEKATWYGALAFFVLAILAAIAYADSGPALPDDMDTPPVTGEEIPPIGEPMDDVPPIGNPMGDSNDNPLP